MAEPRTTLEYNRKVTKNSYTDHQNIQHIACPFCGEPDFFVSHIDKADEVYTKDSTCAHCHRTGHILLSGADAEFVQTGGPDPVWFVKRSIRRAE